MLTFIFLILVHPLTPYSAGIPDNQDPAEGTADEMWTGFSRVIERTDSILNWSSEKRKGMYSLLFDGIQRVEAGRKRDLITLCVFALSAPEPEVYHPAAYILRRFTGKNLGFRSFSREEERKQAARSWDIWWKKSKDSFDLCIDVPDETTLVVDEMPGRLKGDDESIPGRVFHFTDGGRSLWDIYSLKMPYDAVFMEEGTYMVNIIRARAVWEVNRKGEILKRRPAGGYPCSLQVLPGGNLLVAGWDDDRPGFVRELDSRGEIAWRLEDLRWPWKAERLENGNTLVADAGARCVFEVDGNGKRVWHRGDLGPKNPGLFDRLGPVYCQRLPDGNTLVSIRGESRIVELDPSGRCVWEVGPERVRTQYSAVRLWNGNTLIADQGNCRVIEIDVNKKIVWKQEGFGYPAKAYRIEEAKKTLKKEGM